MANLPYSCCNEVPFIMLHPFKGTPCPLISFVRMTPKLASTLHELPLLVYILSKIQLLSNSTITSQDRQSEATAVNINSHNCLITLLNFELLSKVSDDNVMSILLVQSELRANPTIFKMLNKSFISTILLDWQGNSAIAIESNNNDGISSFCFGKSTRTRDVESDWDLLKLFAVQVLPHLMDAVNEDLRMQAVFLLDNRIGGVM